MKSLPIYISAMSVAAKYRAKQLVKTRRFQPGLALLVGAILYNILAPFPTMSQTSNIMEVLQANDKAHEHVISGDAAAVSAEVSEPRLPEIELMPQPAAVRTYQSQVTVYNSVPWQTDGDPFTTASGSRVRDGIVAANCLPFGTKLRMPELYGNKIFTVEDRLHPRKSCYIIDIWQEYSPNSKSFGAPVTTIEILEASPSV
ncbi:MAG: hypothetical protein ABIG66_03700 [Candidatus Kerfeldbacteria bacterium]